MENKGKVREHGITLVALVITIIILLILAGISIQALTQTNLLNQAKQAKNATENAQRQENETLSEYMDKMNEYLPETLAYKVNSGEVSIGSYIKYTPDTVSEETINKLIEELETYSGSEANTKETLKQEMELNWRILDVKDGQVRLISETPTSSTIELKGYNGYNNAVKLLDGVTSTLYNNTKLVSKVQNIKIEDIKRHMKIQPKDDPTEYPLTNINYPNILKQEENQTVEESNVINEKIGVSKQNEFVIGKSKSSNIILKKTYWYKTMNADTDFLDKKYYDLFFVQNDARVYWMSSRCINALSDVAGFCINYGGAGNVDAIGLFNSRGDAPSHSYTFRPVITLNSNIQIDTTNAGEGTKSSPYNIKL